MMNPEALDGLNTTRPRMIMAHPVGMPGRPLTIRSTTVIVDDVWCLTGASSLARRGLTFDGSNDVVLVDWLLDRGASTAIRNHRKALMGAHLGVGPYTGRRRRSTERCRCPKWRLGAPSQPDHRL